MLVPLRYDKKLDQFVIVKKPKEGLLYPFGFLDNKGLFPIKSEKFFRFEKKQIERYNKFSLKEKLTHEVFPLWITENRTLGLIDGRKKMLGLRYKTFQDYEYSVYDRTTTNGYEKLDKESVRLQKIFKPKKGVKRDSNTVLLDPQKYETILKALEGELKRVIRFSLFDTLSIKATVLFKDYEEEINGNLAFVSRSPKEFFNDFAREIVEALGRQGYTFTTHETLDDFYQKTGHKNYLYKRYVQDKQPPIYKIRNNLLEAYEVGTILLDCQIEKIPEPKNTLPRQENFIFDKQRLLNLRKAEREKKKNKKVSLK